MPPITETAIATAVVTPILKSLVEKGQATLGKKMAQWTGVPTARTLVKKVSSQEKVKTIWQREPDVKLSDFYYPSKVKFPEGATRPVESLKDFPRIGNWVIEGTIGQGKSMFLRHLCVQELKKSGSGRVPILVELRNLDSANTLKDSVYKTIESLGFDVTDALFKFYAESGLITLLLDGFDELDEEVVKSAVVQLETWTIAYEEMQIIVTSRPDAEIQKSRHFKVAVLATLSPQDHRPFLFRISIKGKPLESLLKAIEASQHQVATLLTTPLLLTLVAIVYASEQAIPAELPEFFEQVFQTVFTRHDSIKPAFRRNHKTALSERQLRSFFETFCFCAMQSGAGTSLTVDQFDEAFAAAVKLSNDRCRAEDFKHDLVKVACLMQEEGNRIYFTHKSILDYFCAAFIRYSSDDRARAFYGSINKSSNLHPWAAVLHFLEQIDKTRYLKYRVKPQLESMLNEYNVAEKSGAAEQQAVFDLVDRVVRPLKLTYTEDQAGGALRQSSLGPYRPFDDEFDTLTTGTSTLIWSAFPQTVTSPEALKQSFPDATLGMAIANRRTFDVPVASNLNPDAHAALQNRFAAGVQAAKERLSEAERFLEHEAAKTNSFKVQI